MRLGNIASNTAINTGRFICFWIIKAFKSCVHTVHSARTWINANSRATLSRTQENISIEESPLVPLWILPRTKQRAIQRTKDRANKTRWDLDTAIFLFGLLAIIFILSYQGIGIWIIAPIATFGLIMVWLVGFKKARQSYKFYLEEEIVRYPDEWKDYYKILHINPGARPEEIVVAYDRLSTVLKNMRLKSSTAAYTNMVKDAKEAHEVLCDPILKATYDYIYWSSINIATNTDAELIKEFIELSQLIYKEVVRSQRYSIWKIPLIDRISPRAIKATISFVLAILLVGTILAFTKPENVLAAPFRGVANTIAQASAGIVELLNSSREVAASSELKIISTALQSMRVDESLKLVPSAVTSTNDMEFFPSREFCLYPDYIDRRYSQFKYTVTSKGIVTVDTSWAVTDGFLQYMLRFIERIERIE